MVNNFNRLLSLAISLYSELDPEFGALYKLVLLLTKTDYAQRLFTLSNDVFFSSFNCIH